MVSIEIVEMSMALNQDQQDIDLIEKIAVKKDKAAMGQFYQSYRQRLGGFLHRMCHQQSLVDELFNDVMIIVWQKARQFNGKSKVSTWIFSIAYRSCLAKLSKEQKFQPLPEQLEEAYTSESSINEDQILINNAIQTLSLEHRTVIQLAYYSGYSYTEIAEITNTQESTVKTRMFYARKHLQSALANVGVDSRTLKE